MSVAVVTFKMSDFFLHLSSAFGQDLDFQWESFECWGYDEDNVVEKHCHKCDSTLRAIRSAVKSRTNDKGIELTTSNILISFDWCYDIQTDKRVASEIEDIIESTLNLSDILEDKDNYMLHEIVCCKYDLANYKDKKQDNFERLKMYAIYYKK